MSYCTVQRRFYSVAEWYNDDERVMACALVVFTETLESPELIHQDLLACRYVRWLSELERIVSEVPLAHLREWCSGLAYELDCSETFWAKPDILVLEHGAWKLGKEDEED